MTRKLFTFALALLAAASAWAQTTFTVDNLNYTVTDETANTVELTGYVSKPEGILEIPATVSYNSTTYSVTSIGDGAFYWCTALTQIIIPENITSIGDIAFSGCSALTGINIPNNVVNIGIQAFNQCSSLTHITIPNGVKKIGYTAFAHCTALEQVNIGNGVEYIGCMAFYNTALYNNKNNWANNVLYINNYLIQANTGISGDYTITDGTRVIADEAFMDCVELTGVTIPASVIGIGESSFAGCCNLVVLNVEAVIPPAIASNTFNGVHKDIQLNIPAGSEDLYKTDPNWQILFQIMDGKITGTCGDNLTWELIIETGTLTISGTGSMYDYGYDNPPTWSSLYSGYILIAILTEGIENIGNYAFYNCSALTEITIPDGVTSIGDAAFWNCSALMQITIPNSVTNLGSSAFGYCSALTQVTIPDGVTSIEYQTFTDCSALTEITIPDGVTNIGSRAFAWCSKLTQVNIPNSVEGIGDYAFNGCSALTQITIPDGVTNIGEEAFDNCDALMQVDIPNSVTSIGDNAFYSCSSLMQVTIGSGVTSIGKLAFEYCSSLTQVTWNAINCMDFSRYAGKYGPFYDSRSNITTFIFGDQVEHIPAYLCYGMDKLTQVTIPSSIISIGSEAFYDCSALTAVYYTGDVAGWCGITFTGSTSNPLYYAHNLYIDNTLVTRLNIPDGINKIKDYTFLGCNALRQATIPNSVTSIGNGAFAWCSKLTQVNIPNSVTSIGGGAFNGCSALTQVTIPNSVTSIGDGAFSGCSALTQVTIPNSVTSIGDDVFYSCSALMQVTIGNSVTSIGNSAFYNCSALTQVTIGNGVTSIGDLAFYNCSALTQVTIGNSVTSIGHYAFSGCSALAEMTVLATVPPTVGVDAFDGVSREIPVYVPAESLEDYWVAAVWEEFYYLQAMQTALQTPSMPESISVYGGLLHNPQGLPVSIYDMQGRMVYSGCAATVSQPAGVYVVLCAGASRKVLF